MQLAELRKHKLEELRAKFLGALHNSGGARVSHRSGYFKFDEQKAVLLMDQLSIPGYAVSVMDQVRVDPLRVAKWGMYHASAEAQRDTLAFDGKIFRIVAFVELSGAIKASNMVCRGIFCVLAEYIHRQLDESQSTHDNHICCGEDELGGGMRSFVSYPGKVLLFPIECLVPAECCVSTEIPPPPPPSPPCRVIREGVKIVQS